MVERIFEGYSKLSMFLEAVEWLDQQYACFSRVALAAGMPTCTARA